MSPRNRFSFLLFSSVIVLTACGAGKPTDETQSSKLLNTTDTPMELVEEEKQANPVQQHADARKQVNPSVTDNSKYTSKADPKNPDQPVHFRVLKLERQMAGLRDDFGKLLVPLSKLPTGDNELKDTVSQIEMQQQKAASEHIAMYDAPASPMPGAATNDEEAQSASLKDDEMQPAPVVTEHAQGEPLDVAPPPPPVKPDRANRETMARIDVPPQRTADNIEAPSDRQNPIDNIEPQDQEPAAGNAHSVYDSNVSGLRLGEHPGKVRIVLDVTGPAKFAADVDNKQNILIVELAKTGWDSSKEKILKNSLLKGYKVQEKADGSGSILAIKLAKPAKVLMATSLPPNQEYGHRIALDLAPL